jgi:hypothetical protein
MPDRTPELGPIATKILFEDEQVRIWDNRLDPGQVLPPHRHDHDYWLIDVEGERIAVDFLPGNEGEHEGRVELRIDRGRGLFVKKGAVETARNTGSRPLRYILIELKQDANPNSP